MSEGLAVRFEVTLMIPLWASSPGEAWRLDSQSLYGCLVCTVITSDVRKSPNTWPDHYTLPAPLTAF